ncbi:MAG: glycine cleavage system protein GcvH [Chloroflexi bacterium]|nr:glycine cleavage system protein GcvH [Chloroflexota bacterium]MYK62393.1 glycine cleavage system protein GcvH [Chloroflexota bacterium]
MYPDDLKYSSEHEWARVGNGAVVEVGITHYAQDTLGDVVFVELPEIGSRVDQFDKFGEIESVKAVSDLFSPVSGTVTAVNEELEQSPELCNSDPYGDGWIMEVKLDDPSELDELMDSETYQGTLE